MAIDLNQEINLDDLHKRWHRWQLKNTFLLLCGLVLFFFLASVPQVDSFIKSLGTIGLVGAFFVGFFFVLTYTAVPSAFVLFELAKYNNPVEIAAVAAIGSMLGDYVIFRFIKDRVMYELKPYLAKIGTPKMRHLFKTPYFAWLLPVTGALIIASPLPDEAGVGLMGAAKIKNTHFLFFSYVLNVVGIFIVVLLARNL